MLNTEKLESQSESEGNFLGMHAKIAQNAITNPSHNAYRMCPNAIWLAFFARMLNNKNGLRTYTPEYLYAFTALGRELVAKHETGHALGLAHNGCYAWNLQGVMADQIFCQNYLPYIAQHEADSVMALFP